MHNLGEVLVLIICLPGPSGKDPVLQEEQLVARQAVLEEVGLLGLLLPVDAVPDGE